MVIRVLKHHTISVLIMLSDRQLVAWFRVISSLLWRDRPQDLTSSGLQGKVYMLSGGYSCSRSLRVGLWTGPDKLLWISPYGVIWTDLNEVD